MMTRRLDSSRTMRLHRRCGFVLASAICLALSVSPSSAEETHGWGKEDKKAFKRGSDRYGSNDFVGAIEIWKRLAASLGRERGWQVFYNLARAYEATRDFTAAVEHYEAFLEALAQKDEKTQTRMSAFRDKARKYLNNLKAENGALRILPPKSGLVLVRVGLSEPRPAGFTVYLAPGAHELELHARTAQAERRSIRLVAGETTEITVSASEQPATPTPTPPDRSARGAREFPTTWVLVGAGLTVVSSALPILMYSRASGKRDDAAALGPQHPDYGEAKDDFESAGTWYQVSYAVPAVFAVGTIAIATSYWLGSDDQPVEAGAVVLPGGGQVSIQGRF